MKVPFLDLGAQHQEVADEVRRGFDEVCERTAFVGGAEVTAFEAEYADYVGTEHCVGVGNGTDALELALRALGVGVGDEVILPANTFIATAEAVAAVGARVVLVDVDEEHLLIDPGAVERAITARTRAIVPVHLFGQTAAVEALTPLAESAGAVILEDAAQAQGARRHGRPTGSLGRVAATSFYPGKNLGAAGDAGAVMTSDGELAERVRALSAHGSLTKYVHDLVGRNSRLDTLQAVVLRAKLQRLEKWNDLRRQAAERYASLLADVSGLRLPLSASGNEDVWHLYVVRTARRDAVLAALTEAGVGAGIHYPTPVHLTGAFVSLGAGPGSFPVAERASAEILSLPMYPHLRLEQQEYVAERLQDAVGG
jgi:dTDP-4-amino-4,6-dideoxygalactose transaminase